MSISPSIWMPNMLRFPRSDQWVRIPFDEGCASSGIIAIKFGPNVLKSFINIHANEYNGVYSVGQNAFGQIFVIAGDDEGTKDHYKLDARQANGGESLFTATFDANGIVNFFRTIDPSNPLPLEMIANGKVTRVCLKKDLLYVTTFAHDVNFAANDHCKLFTKDNIRTLAYTGDIYIDIPSEGCLRRADGSGYPIPYDPDTGIDHEIWELVGEYV